MDECLWSIIFKFAKFRSLYKLSLLIQTLRTKKTFLCVRLYFTSNHETSLQSI